MVIKRLPMVVAKSINPFEVKGHLVEHLLPFDQMVVPFHFFDSPIFSQYQHHPSKPQSSPSISASSLPLPSLVLL